MNVLVRGCEKEEYLEILFELSGGRMSDDSKDACKDYLIKGHTEELSASMNKLKLSNFSRTLARLNKIAGLVNQAKELS